MNKQDGKEEEFVVKACKALADKQRLRIFKLVADRGSIMCNEAVEATGLSQPTVSHHVKQLVEAELLQADKDGRCNRLSVQSDTVKQFLGVLLRLS